MFSRKAIGLLLTFLLIGLVGVPVWLTYRQARQDGLNRALIAAIQRRHDVDVPAALACLKAGADPNSRDDGSKPLSFWLFLRRLFIRIWKPDKPTAAQPEDTALILALEIKRTTTIFSIVSPDYHRADVTPLIRALVAGGANVNARDEVGAPPL